jgi:hypothetical protein
MKNNYQATIISVVPFPIKETKPGIYPGIFEIPAAKTERPEILLIGESIYHVEVDEGRRHLTVKCPPNDVARSVVDDYLISNLAYKEGYAGPGIFWVPQAYSMHEVINELEEEINEARRVQKNWFIALVRMADDDWEKSRQHKTISDTQRYAAKSLGYKRDWIVEPKELERSLVNCRACQTTISPEAVVCPQCGCVMNIEAWEKLKFSGDSSSVLVQTPMDTSNSLVKKVETPENLDDALEMMKGKEVEVTE